MRALLSRFLNLFRNIKVRKIKMGILGRGKKQDNDVLKEVERQDEQYESIKQINKCQV